jgi:hypothetical protein
MREGVMRRAAVGWIGEQYPRYRPTRSAAMVNRWMGVGLFSTGVVIGVALAELPQELVLSAQAGWQCRSWTLESTEGADAVGPWLGAAARVEIAAADRSTAGRYTLVACKQ